MEPLDEGAVTLATMRLEERRGDEARVSIAGEIDISNADELRGSIARVVDDGTRRVVFDLRDVVHLDSSGIAVLLGAAERTEVEIQNASPFIVRLLRVTGVGDILHVVE